MKNYKLTIQYDGTNYSGWQIQKNVKTVQQTLSDAIKKLLKCEINLIGSGRTDAGVHAIGQVANFRTESEIDVYRFKYSLNAILPDDICVSEMIETDYNFHARFDAKKRSYIYQIIQNKSPFYKNYAYFYPQKIDIERLNSISRLFLSQVDFAAFSKKNAAIENNDCKIFDVKWKRKSELIIFQIQANRFLHGMVRAITGTLLKAQQIENAEKFLTDIFNSKDRSEAYDSVPAKGLFLYKVEY